MKGTDTRLPQLHRHPHRKQPPPNKYQGLSHHTQDLLVQVSYQEWLQLGHKVYEERILQEPKDEHKGCHWD